MSDEYIIYDPAEFDKIEIKPVENSDEITRLRADLAAVTAERDRMRDLLVCLYDAAGPLDADKMPADDFAQIITIVLDARAAVTEERDALAARLAPVEAIENDKDDPTREYIPLPGGWEIQTKGKGSSYRLLDKKTGERHMILAGEAPFVQEFVTRMAKEINAAAAIRSGK